MYTDIINSYYRRPVIMYIMFYVAVPPEGARGGRRLRGGWPGGGLRSRYRSR